MKRKSLTVAALISGAMCLWQMPAARAAADEQQQLSKADKEFLKDAAESGITEVELGKLAEKKAASPQVKMLGEHLVKDHEKANAELMKIAKSKGVELKVEPTETQKMEIGGFEKREGEKFDKEFQQHIAKDHKKAIALFEKEAKNGSDAEIKAFAEKMLPGLKQHLEMSENAAAGGEKKTGSSEHQRSGGEPKGMPNEQHSSGSKPVSSPSPASGNQ